LPDEVKQWQIRSGEDIKKGEGGLWQETFVTYFKVFPGHLPGRNTENHQGSMPVVRIHNFQVQV